MRVNRLFRLLVLSGVLCASAAWGADGGEEPEIIDLPPLPARTEKARLHAERQRVQRACDRKLQKARVLFRVGRFGDCIDLCEEVLSVDEGHAGARLLRRQAIDRQSALDDANQNVESHRRDRATLRFAERLTQAPERGTDLLRPDPEASLPFRRNAQDVQSMDAILGARIPRLNLVDTDVSYLLQLLFETHDINIIYPPEAVEDKRITIQVMDVTLGDILEYLSRNQGLHYTVSKNIVWLYAEGEDNGGDLFRPEIIQLKTGLTFDSAGGGGADGGQPSGTATDIEALLDWMTEEWPGWPEATTWRLNYKTNQLIISSTPRIIEDVRQLVSTLDVPPVQIMITANFLQVSKSDLDELGLDWSVSPNPQRNADDEKAEFTESGARGEHDKITISDSSGQLSGFSGAVAPQEGAALYAVGVLNEHEFGLTLRALSRRSGTRAVSAPQTIAKNNSVSEIELTTTTPYVREYDTETSGISTDTGAATNTVSTPVWDEVEEGYKLKVVPSVGGDMRNVSLQVEPDITNRIGWEEAAVVTVQSSGQQNTDTVVRRPVLTKNTTKVEATVLDGHTLVVGGLITDQASQTDRGVPLLSKLPILGRAFKSNTTSRDQTVLLIFVTARIISPGNRTYTDSVPEPRPSVTPAQVNEWLGDPVEAGADDGLE